VRRSLAKIPVRPPKESLLCPGGAGIKALMPRATDPQAESIRFKTNVIAPMVDAPGGRVFISAGDPSPYRSINEVPENLRPVIATEADFSDEPNVPRGAFQLGELYRVTDDDRLGRRLERQAARMEAAVQEQEWVEEQLDASLPPEIAADLQEDHENAIAFAKAQAAADARRADELADSVIATQDPPTLFVRRGSRHYAQAHKTRLKPGEPVFIRQANGRFECIGETDGDSQLPDPPTIV
jgi:hypothetical protein